MADAWLKGPVAGVPAALQPVAHAFMNLQLELENMLADVSDEELWLRPGDVAPIGFHVRHLCGSIDRLLTYARGESLDDAQLATLESEKSLKYRASVDEMRALVRRVVERGIAQLRETPEGTLADARGVGRKQLPSTVAGLLFHAAEHGARHTGQAITTRLFVRSAG